MNRPHRERGDKKRAGIDEDGQGSGDQLDQPAGQSRPGQVGQQVTHFELAVALDEKLALHDSG